MQRNIIQSTRRVWGDLSVGIKKVEQIKNNPLSQGKR